MRTLAVCVLVILASACSLFTRSIERPTATVREVTIRPEALARIHGELALDVANPNAFGVPLAGIDWELAIAGHRAITGAVTLSQTIPARGVAPVRTSLQIDVAAAARIVAAIAAGARDYRLAVRLRFSTPVGPLDVGVQHAGELGAPRGLVETLIGAR